MLRVVPQLRTDLATKANDCGFASVVVLETGYDWVAYPHPNGRQERGDRIAAARVRAKVPAGPSTLRDLQRSFTKLPGNPPMRVVDSGKADFDTTILPALGRGAVVLLGVQYDVINAYKSGAVSGQPGRPLDPGHPACTGPHWVVITGLRTDIDGRHFTWMTDPLRDGRRDLPKGPVEVPMWLMRNATAAYNGRTSGVVAGLIDPMPGPVPVPNPCDDLEPPGDGDASPDGGGK